jgi:uncharacterized protein YbjQ (UPF0145 family)/DNA-binding NarL/FixJ family response regulator
MVRGALKALLAMEGDIEIVAETDRADRVVPLAVASKPDVALLDIEMPGGDGITAAGQLRNELPSCKTLILTTFGRPGFLRRAMESGASGFMLKDAPAHELALAIRRTMAGERVVDPGLAAAALSAGISPLSERSARCWSRVGTAPGLRRSRRHSSSQKEPCATTSRRRFRSWRSVTEPRRRASQKTKDGCNHHTRRAKMIVVTTEEVTGHRIVEMKGQVFGLVVRSRGLGGNIVATLRSLGGGEIVEYTELAHQARQQALDRLADQAAGMGANAVLSVMFDSSELGQTMEEIIAFGTAVVVSPTTDPQQLVKLS